MSDDTTTAPETSGEETKKTAPRRRTGKIKAGETVVATVRIAFVDGRVGEEDVVEATDRLLDLEARGYVSLRRVAE